MDEQIRLIDVPKFTKFIANEIKQGTPAGTLPQLLKYILDNKPDFTPITSNQVNNNGQGIVGLSLEDAIIWLANNRCCNYSTDNPTTNNSFTYEFPFSLL